MPAILAPGREWSHAEIHQDCSVAKADFRTRRLSGPLRDYLEEYPNAKAAADHIVSNLSYLVGSPADQALLADAVADPAKFVALRYSAAVPISEDDLEALLGSAPSARSLRKDQAQADALASLLLASLDPVRFPWIANETSPSQQEIDAASLASAVAATIARVQTKRRGDERAALEDDIEAALVSSGFSRVPTPRASIAVLANGPRAGTFMKHCTLGVDNADFVVGLNSGRLLAIEAKASNSEVNSRKRLNKEVVQDARQWLQTFGAQVIAAAALRGVFKPSYVEDAQRTPVLIFWGHRLEDLSGYLKAAA